MAAAPKKRRRSNFNSSDMFSVGYVLSLIKTGLACD
jgi:hypothetical protein